jgi:DNA integrity scanning protein DisA with diadenylate cyclase activity
VIRTAGTYLRPEVEAEGLPAGLGTRHQVAAAVSRETHATAVVLSQSTGTVAVFRGGRAVLTLERSRPGLI